jgi:hypothetical protein
MPVRTFIFEPPYEDGFHRIVYVGDLSEVPDVDLDEARRRFRSGDINVLISANKPAGRVALFCISLGYNRRDADIVRKVFRGLGAASGNFDYVDNNEAPHQVLSQPVYAAGIEASRELGLFVPILYSRAEFERAREFAQSVAEKGATPFLVEREYVLAQRQTP